MPIRYLFLFFCFSFTLQAQTEKDLFYAVFDSDYTAVQKVLESKPDFNALYSYERYREECEGWTVMHIAAAMGNLRILKLLAAHGGNLLARVASGSEDRSAPFAMSTTLHIAAAYGNQQIASYLLDNGLEVDAIAGNMRTPLLSAIMENKRQNTDVIRLLLDRGAEFNLIEGRSPLFEAIWANKADIAKLLLDRGAQADVLCKDTHLQLPHSVSPMYAAIYKHHNRLLQLLFDYGASVQNELATSLLHWAVQQENIYAAAFLLQRGAKQDTEDAQGKTVSDLALEQKEENPRMWKLFERGRLQDIEREMYELLLSEKFQNFNLKERPAANFELKDLYNQKVVLENYKGRVVLLNVWATWCPPCLKELPSLKKMLDKLRRSDVLVAAASIDDRAQKVLDYVAKNRYPFIFLHDTEDRLRSLYDGIVPSTFIIDKDGRILASIEGTIDWSSDAYIQFVRLVARLDGKW